MVVIGINIANGVLNNSVLAAVLVPDSLDLHVSIYYKGAGRGVRASLTMTVNGWEDIHIENQSFQGSSVVWR